MNRLFVRVIVFLCALVVSSPAWAEGFALYEFSARSIALGGATMARKPDPSVLASNPAAMTRLEGTQIQTGVAAIAPRGRMKGYDQNGDSFSVSLKKSVWPVPSFYFTHKFSDRFAVGVGQFSRFGLGFEYPHNWPGRFNIYEVSLTTSSLNPNVAVAITDKLSVAAGVEIMYTNLNMKKRTAVDKGPLHLEVDSNIHKADSFGYGYNFAAHYQFNEQWAAGLAYRSHVTLKNEGEMQYTLVKNNMGAIGEKVFASNFPDGDAWGRVRLPESISGGVSYTPIPELSIEAGAVWTRWSRFDALDIHLPDQNAIAYNTKTWRNAWRFNAGVEYSPLDWLALRAGYVYDQSPMQDKHSDYLIPSAKRHIYSAGVGLSYADWTVDLAYSYIDVTGRKYRADNESQVLKSKVTRAATDIYAISIGYKF